MAHDDRFLMKFEHDRLLMDADTALKVMKLLSDAVPVTFRWNLREKGVFPYMYTETRDPNASISYVSISELAQLELNSDNTHTD